MKKARVFASFLMAMLLLTSCTKTTTDETTATDYSVESTTTEAVPVETEKASEFCIEALKELDGVVSVEEIGFKSEVPDMTKTDDHIVLMVFEQPLDWNDPSKGTFNQRVEVCYSEKNRNNSLKIGGYNLNNDAIAMGSYSDIYTMKNEMNLISIEYRFFGESAPEGLSINDKTYWEYLTSYNAACDFHHVITELKKVLPGTWLMSGGSKGGVATMAQSMYFPEDADIFMAMVAPVMESPETDGFIENIYETIGNEAYGEEEAAEYRQLVLDFQVEAIKLRDQLQDRVYEQSLKEGNSFTEFAAPEIVYDNRVMSFAIGVWQYEQNFNSIEGVLECKDEEDYPDLVYELLIGIKDPEQEKTTEAPDLSPYWIQCITELGYFKADFSYLRDALEKDGSGATLAVTEEMEDMFYYRMILEPDMIDAFTFDSSFRNDLIDWTNNTSSNVILIYGGTDVWYPLRLPDVEDRDNFHIFVASSDPHTASIYKLDIQDQKDAQALINEAMGN